MHPLDIVHNATTSSLHDEMKARERADAEKRRAHLDKQRAVVKQNPREARLYSHNLGGVHTHASVVIKVPWKDGSTKTYITCELSVDHEGLTLITVCPSCVYRHHRPVAESQLTMRSWHRRFSLDSFGEGELWVNPQNPAEVIQLAGTIETHEVQTCPDCHYRFQIEKSRDPRERGLCVMREA